MLPAPVVVWLLPPLGADNTARDGELVMDNQIGSIAVPVRQMAPTSRQMALRSVPSFLRLRPYQTNRPTFRDIVRPSREIGLDSFRLNIVKIFG